MEICEMLNNLDEEGVDRVSICLINSDICYFLAKILSYQQDYFAIQLVNKIVCFYSETDVFFKHAFFRMLQAYIRVLNSFPENGKDSKDPKKHSDILTCIGLIVKRSALPRAPTTDKF
jgi:hypothetical protein